MTLTSLDQFEREAKADGYDEVLQRDWTADSLVRDHTHPFDAYAVVVQGEMWLTCDGATRHITPGGTFSLPRNTVHSERYGSQGVSYWVARRS